MSESLTLLFQLFESRIPKENFSPSQLKQWRRAIEEVLFVLNFFIRNLIIYKQLSIFLI